MVHRKGLESTVATLERGGSLPSFRCSSCGEFLLGHKAAREERRAPTNARLTPGLAFFRSPFRVPAQADVLPAHLSQTANTFRQAEPVRLKYHRRNLASQNCGDIRIAVRPVETPQNFYLLFRPPWPGTFSRLFGNAHRGPRRTTH